MMAKAGVTCALDMAGRPEPFFTGLREAGAGLTVGYVYPLVPGETLAGRDPDRTALARITDEALRQGALGVKILGGHIPLTPEATARVIRITHNKRCWCAVHAGTTAAGSDIEGLEELVALADGLPVHIAHICAYCRGQKTGDPLVEASRALAALQSAPRARSESHLALINVTGAAMEGGVPKSNVTKTCLKMGGYPATVRGMEAAIEAGWAQVYGTQDGETVLLSPTEGLTAYHASDSEVVVGFLIYPPGASIAISLARDGDAFIVTALSTDGGAWPRNTTLIKGLALVRFGALSLDDFVVKACLNPARMLGVEAKGHLGIGSDADLVVVDPTTAGVDWAVAEGEIIVERGTVVGRRGRLITTAAGQAFLSEQGIEARVVTPDWI
jgi:hypothetical protein